MAGIETNINAMHALYQMNVHNRLLTQALERLSSGYRINRAADDPSGLAIADKFRSRVRAFQQAARNVGLATNLVRTAEDGMTRVLNFLFTMRDLALEAIDSTFSTSDRLVNQTEINQLLTEIDRLSTAVKFNGIRLLNGTFSSKSPVAGSANQLSGSGTYQGSLVFQVGPDKGSKMKTFVATMSARSISVNGVLVTSQLDASNAVAILNSAVTRVLSRRARIGGVEEALQSAQTISDLSADSHLAAESAIRDADVAAETVNFTKEQILVQASSAMLAQANLLSKNVLELLLSSIK